MYLKIVILVLCAVLGTTSAVLRCYSCSFSSADSDQSCLTITNDTRSIDCTYQYCTVLRQEFLDPPGAIASFSRGCDDQPDFLNNDVTDNFFHTFYRACTSDLCNIGNGIQSIVGGGLQPNPQYDGPNLRVPGTGGAAALSISLFMIVFTTLLINML